MTKTSRILVMTASLALLLIYAFPLWSISLEAPQYPEGLGMKIWVNTITGESTHDLRNINNLNHYIGMKTIEPDAIRELAIMPWAVGFLVISGLVVAAAGRPWLLYGWFGLLAVLAVAGLVDFWLWQYDYGHNLSPDAAIKIPGMSYQPPLIGSKSILNFRAHSWPAPGGWAAFGAGFLGALAVFLEVRARRRGRSSAEASVARAEAAGQGALPGGRGGARRRGAAPAGSPASKGSASSGEASAPARRASLGGSGAPGEALAPARTAGAVVPAVSLTAAVLLLAGCGPSGPVPIAYGEDTCALCVMTVSDERYGTELLTRKGRAYMFDSVECMANFYLRQDPAEVASMWVTDFRDPGRLIPLEDAIFLRSPELRSPMGMNLTAFGEGAEPGALLAAYGGEVLNWDGILDVVRSVGRPGAGMEGVHGMHQHRAGHGEELRPAAEPHVDPEPIVESEPYVDPEPNVPLEPQASPEPHVH
jgi:copper chaperone NosL